MTVGRTVYFSRPGRDNTAAVAKAVRKLLELAGLPKG